MLIACPVYADPADFDIEVVDGSNFKVKVNLKNLSRNQGVAGAVIRGTAAVGSQGIPTTLVPMRAVPTSIPGEYVFKTEAGVVVFDLDVEAEVPGEAAKIAKKLIVNNQNSQGNQNAQGNQNQQ